MAQSPWGDEPPYSLAQQGAAASVVVPDREEQKKRESMARLKKIAEARQQAVEQRNQRLKEAEIQGLLSAPSESSEQFIPSRLLRGKLPFQLAPYSQGFNKKHKGLLPDDVQYLDSLATSE